MDVFDIYAKLSLDSKDYDKALHDAADTAQEFATKLIIGLKGAGQAIGSALSAVTSAVVDITKSAVDAYSSYQQLVGGVETLFKDASDIVVENASKAFATAGMSANEYMDTVTSFSASLIQSTGRGAQQDLEELEENLNQQYKETKRHWEDRIALVKDSSEKTSLKRQMEDELEMLKKHNKEVLAEAEEANMMSVSTTESLERAARLADQAIIDMSDNANKMGTDMASIQNAYQGFAKQNYTMLDNLKLGYGGTKHEMERLLKDAERLAGVKFDISSYADIVEAIHVIQQELGITGTTAEEAAGTISGSMKALQAAWTDLLTSLAGGGVEMNQAIDNLIKTAEAFLENMIPIIERTLYGIGDLIQNIAPIIAERLPELISTLLPMILDTAMYLVSSLVEALPQLVETLATALIDIIPQLVEATVNLIDALLTTIIPLILEVGIALVLALGEGIANNIEQILDSVVQLLQFIVDIFLENLPMILDVGLRIILALVEGLLMNINPLTDMIVQLIGGIVQTIVENIPLLLEMGLKIGLALVEGILLAIPSLVVSIGRFFGIIDKAQDDVSNKGKSMKSDMDITFNGIVTSANEASKKVSSASKDMSVATEKTSKETYDYSRDVIEHTKAASLMATDALTKIKVAFEGMIQHAEKFYNDLKKWIDKSIGLLDSLSNFIAMPKVDPSGVEAGCRAIVDACDDAIRALNSLSSTSSGGGGFGGGRASGGWMNAGTTYLVGEQGPELVTATSNAFVHNAQETAGILNGRGDVYDDERSMKKKFKTAVLDILESQVAYG